MCSATVALEALSMSDPLDQISKDRSARDRRDQQIAAARRSGLSYAAIGRMFKMSGDNVKDRIARLHQTERVHKSDNPFVKLTPQTLRLLQAQGLLTVERVVDAYQKNELYGIRNFGTKRLREVEKWFPVKPANRP